MSNGYSFPYSSIPTAFSPGIAAFVTSVREQATAFDDGVVFVDREQTFFHDALNYTWRDTESPENATWCAYTVTGDPQFSNFEFLNSSSPPVEITWDCGKELCDSLNLTCMGDESRFALFFVAAFIVICWVFLFKVADFCSYFRKKWRRRNFRPASYFEMSVIESDPIPNNKPSGSSSTPENIDELDEEDII